MGGDAQNAGQDSGEYHIGQIVHSAYTTPPRHSVDVLYSHSTVPDCVGYWPDENVEVRGSEIAVTILLREPPPLPWDTGCGDKLTVKRVRLSIPDGLQLGEQYTLTANGEVVSAFTVPSKPLLRAVPAKSWVERVELIETEGSPARYSLRVTAGMPEGDQCTQFNGYEFQWESPGRVNVEVTYYDLFGNCTQDYPVVVTDGDFIEPGEDYVVTVNGGHRQRIRGR